VHQLVLASDNPGKLREFRALLAPLAVTVSAQRELGIAATEEPYESFVENALAKARHAARSSGLPALADDSGLCCVALNGAPGVRSARFASAATRAPGNGNSRDEDNNRELLRQLAAHSQRRAHYTCVLVALRAPDDPEPVIAIGQWHGEITQTPRGGNGFGYDPYFFLPKFGQTAAELAPEHKNRISHRALAIAQCVQELRTRWGW
jgi:XTP/dITP diphosphohydrolase